MTAVLNPPQTLKLSDEFLAKYKNRQPNWGPLGWLTFKRTYARPILDENGKRVRLEEWWETCARVINGDLQRMLKAGDPRPVEELIAEAEEMYDAMFNLAWLPSGRNLWMSGTDWEATRGGSALVNCWAITIRRYYKKDGTPEPVSFPFRFMFDRLMTGGGVGFRVLPEDVATLPKVRRMVKLIIHCDPDHPDYETRLRKTGVTTSHDYDDIYIVYNNVEHFRVPDTREGWAEAMAKIIDAHFDEDGPDVLIIDVSDIRPYGAPIKGFGGTASGPEPLVILLQEHNQILNNAIGRQITTIEALDMGNLIGKCVVAGNVRRSAELCGGSPKDKEFREAKLIDWANPPENTARWASNNSVIIGLDYDDFEELAEAIGANGEPGVINLDLARNYGRIVDGPQPGIDAYVVITNPCGEIFLEDGEPCNLVELFLPRIFELGYDPKRIARLAQRYAYRVTFADYSSWGITQEVIERNRRIGVSLSGTEDWFLLQFGRPLIAGWKVDDEGNEWPIYDQEITQIIDELYKTIREDNRWIAQLYGANPSIKMTTNKPSGSISKLVGVSEGIHKWWAPYMIRRIRFQDIDPLVKLLEKCGYRVEPDHYTPNTMVVEIPLKAPSADIPGFKSAGETPLAEQFATQAFFATYWADNSVSATLNFTEKEKPLIADLLRQYKNVIKSTSLLPYANHGYIQPPIEAISKEEYEARMAEIKMRPEDAASLLEELGEDQLFEILDQMECQGGACPVK